MTAKDSKCDSAVSSLSVPHPHILAWVLEQTAVPTKLKERQRGGKRTRSGEVCALVQKDLE